jgi:hypothetical protein
MARSADRLNALLADSMRQKGVDADSTFHQLELGPVPSMERPPAPSASDMVSSYHEGDYKSLVEQDQAETPDDESATVAGALEGQDGTLANRRGFTNRLRAIRDSSFGSMAATAYRRIGNLVEGTIARTFALPMYMDNAWMAYASTPSKRVGSVLGMPITHTDWAKVKDRVAEATLPEVQYNNYQQDQESTPVVEQLTDIQEASLAAEGQAKGAGIFGLLDREPQVIEGFKKMSTYQDAIVNRMFQGDEASYGAWLNDQNRVQRAGHLAGLAFFQTYVQPSSLLAANKQIGAAMALPFKAAGVVAQKTVVPLIKAAAEAAPEAVKAGVKGAVEGLGREATRLGSKEIFRRKYNIADLDANVTMAEARVQQLQEEFTLKQDPKVGEQLAQAHKRAADARLKLDNHTASIGMDPILMHAPRSNADIIADMELLDPDQRLSIRPSQYRALRARRAELAEKIMPQADVEKEMQRVGFKDWNDYLERMGAAHREIKSGTMAADPNLVGSLNPMVEDMRRVERMSEGAKQHLSVRGLSRDKIVSAAALLREPSATAHISQWTDFSNPAMVEQRLIGPDNAEDMAEALKHMAQGASPEHVFVYDTVIPEHDIIGRGQRPLWANNFWVGEDKAIWENGRKVLEGDEYWRGFAERGQPGLAKGAKVLNPFRVVNSAINRVWNDARQQMSAYGELPSFRLLKQAGGNHQTFTVAANEATRESTSKLLPEGVEVVNKALQAEDEFALEGMLRGMSADEKEVYLRERARWDYHADRLGMPPGKGIKQYVAAVIPRADLEAGNRVIELIAPGTNSTVGFRHLLPRLGEAGYVEGYHEIADVYHRLLFRKLIMEPAYAKALQIADVYAERGMMGQSAYTRRMVDSMRGVPQGISRLIDHNLGLRNGKPSNATERVAAAVGSTLYTAMLGFKSSYLFQQIGTAMNNMGAQLGVFGMVRGMMRLASPEGLALAEKSGVAGVARHVIESENGFVQRLYKAAGKYGGASSSEDAIRYLNQQSALGDLLQRAGKTWEQVVAEGRGHAYQAEAYDAVLNTQHLYGAQGRSPYWDHWLGRPMASLATQFSNFPGFAYKQTEMLGRMAAQDPGALVRYFALGGMMLRTMDQFHVDASRVVGLGYLQGGSGKGGWINSPSGNLIHEMQGVNEAMATDDPTKVKLAVDKVDAWVDSAIPFVSSLAAAYRQGTRSASMEVRGPGGSLDRSLAPEEKVPTMLGLPTREGRIARQVREQQTQAVKDWIFVRRDATERFIKMVDRGDFDKAQQYAQILAEHGIPLSPNMIEAQAQARYVGSVLRTQMKYSDVLSPELLDQINLMSQFPHEEPVEGQ